MLNIVSVPTEEMKNIILVYTLKKYVYRMTTLVFYY